MPLVNARREVRESMSDIEELAHPLAIPKLHTNEKNRRKELASESTKFSIRVGSANPLMILNELLREINSLAGLILEAWSKYLQELSRNSVGAMKVLAADYEQKLATALHCFTSSAPLKSDDSAGAIRLKVLSQFRPHVPVNSGKN